MSYTIVERDPSVTERLSYKSSNFYKRVSSYSMVERIPLVAVSLRFFVIRLGLNVTLTHKNRLYRDSETKGNVEE